MSLVQGGLVSHAWCDLWMTNERSAFFISLLGHMTVNVSNILHFGTIHPFISRCRTFSGHCFTAERDAVSSEVRSQVTQTKKQELCTSILVRLSSLMLSIYSCPHLPLTHMYNDYKKPNERNKYIPDPLKRPPSRRSLQGGKETNRRPVKSPRRSLRVSTR